MQKGLFITFEGIDGCGKTTQINLLNKYLKERGFMTLLTREPGSPGLGVKIREILLNYDGEVAPNCESFLFLADRAQHVDCIIKPALQNGEIVLCDRYTDSTLAYQGYGRGIDIERIKYLNETAVNGLKPDLTFVFDISAETSFRRVGESRDRMESAGKDFFNRVRNGYLEIANNEPDRVKIIDASDTIENIHNKVVETVENLYECTRT